MVFEANAMMFVTETLACETKTVVSKPGTIVLAAGTMVFPIKKIFSLEETIVFGIDTTLCVKNTMAPMWNTTVTAAKTMVSVAPIMVCKVLSIGVLIVEQSIANPSWLFLISSPLTSFLLREIRHQIRLNVPDSVDGRVLPGYQEQASFILSATRPRRESSLLISITIYCSRRANVTAETEK